MKYILFTFFLLFLSNCIVGQNGNSASIYIPKKVVAVNPGTSKLADVDVNIPQLAVQNPNRFAIIFGNEDYSKFNSTLTQEVNVRYAVQDGRVFQTYAERVLGINPKQIRYFENATLGQMRNTLNWINQIAKAYNGEAELFFYYAGHGIPHEQNKESYLMPVDAVASDYSTSISLKEVYSKLTEFPSKSVTVFLDACFSGGGRNLGLVEARGVKIRPKEDALNGNLVVFAATQGDEVALSFDENKHGMFTYFLLKKLQDSKGNVSYKELATYLQTNVSRQSLIINNKLQNPQVKASSGAVNWERWKFVN